MGPVYERLRIEAAERKAAKELARLQELDVGSGEIVGQEDPVNPAGKDKR